MQKHGKTKSNSPRKGKKLNVASQCVEVTNQSQYEILLKGICLVLLQR